VQIKVSKVNTPGGILVTPLRVPIKILVAEASEMMSKCIVRFLNEESGFQIVGVAANFAKAMQMRVDFKPDVLLMDLHLPEKREFTPALVKSQLASLSLVAISTCNDDDAEAKALAESYGALVLLDKMKLYDQLIPTIKQLCADESFPADSKSFRG
jgi:chemotaxis response regulator CheB